MYQQVFTKIELACEMMINWAREIAKEYDMSFDEITKMEEDIRMSCYYDNKEDIDIDIDIDIDLGKYSIAYREFTMVL